MTGKSKEFQYAWLKAVATVWRSPEKQALLIQDPKGFLHRECGYTLPEHIVLHVIPPDDKIGARSPGGSADTKLVITVRLPEPPKGDEDVTMSLIEYTNDSGYPCIAC